MHTKAFPQHMEAWVVVQVINQFSYLPHHSGQVLHNLFIPKVLLPPSPREAYDKKNSEFWKPANRSWLRLTVHKQVEELAC